MGATHVDKEIRAKAVGLVVTDKQKVSEVAKQLNIQKASIYRWINEEKRNGSGGKNGHSANGARISKGSAQLKAATPKGGISRDGALSSENARLREQLAVIVSERDHLRQTIGILANPTRA